MLDTVKTKEFKTLFGELLKEDSAATNELIKSFAKGARAASQKAYAKGVAARKQEREVTRAKRQALAEELRVAKEDLKAKKAAAAALVEKKGTRAKKAKGAAPAAAFKPKTELIKKAKRTGESRTPTEVVNSMAGGLADLPNL
jgi:truncated hemoglobin YjbI